MNRRRTIHLSRVGLHDRRVRWADRRQHTGMFRWLWIPVPDLWFRFWAR